VPGPYLTKILLDQVQPHADFGLRYVVLALGAGLSTFLGLTGSLHGYFAQQVNTAMHFDFQGRLYPHLQGLDFAFCDQRETSEVLLRFGDIGALTSALLGGLQLLVFPLLLFCLHWKLALLSIAILPLDALLAARRSRTTLIIAHSLAAMRCASEIAVLEEGYIAEQGPHELLVLQGGLYASLHAQLSGAKAAVQFTTHPAGARCAKPRRPLCPNGLLKGHFRRGRRGG